MFQAEREHSYVILSQCEEIIAHKHVLETTKILNLKVYLSPV